MLRIYNKAFSLGEQQKDARSYTLAARNAAKVPPLRNTGGNCAAGVNKRVSPKTLMYITDR